MLTQLTIQNYAIVETLDLDLHGGMTVISGETGAGKSIMLDALGLTLGDRADSGAVRNGAERAEIVASFDLSSIGEARDWLQAQQLDCDGECLLRRVITKEGRSRSYINGQPCPLNLLREFGSLLIDIHGQHEHQRLLKKDHHRTLLDDFAGQARLAGKVREQFLHWQRLARELRQLTEQSDEQAARVQLLSYQIEELDQLALSEGELDELEAEQKTLAHAGEILQTGHQLLAMTGDDEGDTCLSLLNHCQQLLANLSNHTDALGNLAELLGSAQIQIEEAGSELRHYLDRVELNPERQQFVEERLSTLYETARKHRIRPDQLLSFHRELYQELAGLQRSDEDLEQLQQQVEQARAAYQTSAEKLSRARRKAAGKLNKAVDQQLHALGMPAAHFEAALTPLPENQQGPHGLEEVEFLISANRGQPARPLAKVASGGELSRISLAIQVITAQTSSTPTLIFDEVDVGIGGAIAEVVGRMLRQLGGRTQILCVTHQPQVASQGHQHLFVSKRADKQQTHTRIAQLTDDQRVQEVARMLGGIDITERSIEHAREMLSLPA
ncbi:DNA repair protein RecN [Marinobacterium arenosum]|uniref:DNA repair protein RecN n=1 Tax=Marinobacterium arenosum TaxID=2862496 RepID=UPI001C97A9E2|nr:DNA repair protein RecN [Marinobacterium arenosum]MBY4677369.1 DNA repair protein RecN [Marinobacterium arenosum]